jgi:hypothetical protein
MKEFGGGQMKLMDDDELGSFARFNTAAPTWSRRSQIPPAPDRRRRLSARGRQAGTPKRLKALEDELNRHLAGEYGVKVSDKVAYAKWVKSHQPFHWFIQFYGILSQWRSDLTSSSAIHI